MSKPVGPYTPIMAAGELLPTSGHIGIADGDVAKGIKAYNPILAGQLTREEIEACSKDSSKSILVAENLSLTIGK